MNSMVVIVASEVASSPDNLALINRMDSSMCFFGKSECLDPASDISLTKRADVHKTAWKRAASVITKGNQAESLALAWAGSIKAASEWFKLGF